MRRLRVLLLVAVVAVACAGRDAPDAQALHRDIVNDANGAEVTFDAMVLNEPVVADGHERFKVKVPTGEMLEVDHNTTLARPVPAHAGDHLVIHGRLYIDPGPRIGVHCTHAHTSSGCPNPGWIMLGDDYYE